MASRPFSSDAAPPGAQTITREEYLRRWPDGREVRWHDLPRDGQPSAPRHLDEATVRRTTT